MSLCNYTRLSPYSSLRPPLPPGGKAILLSLNETLFQIGFRASSFQISCPKEASRPIAIGLPLRYLPASLEQTRTTLGCVQNGRIHVLPAWKTSNLRENIAQNSY